MDKEHLLVLQDVMKDILKMAKNLDLVPILGKTEENIQECIKMTKKMDMVSCMIQKDILYIKVYGKMMKLLEMEYHLKKRL